MSGLIAQIISWPIPVAQQAQLLQLVLQHALQLTQQQHASSVHATTMQALGPSETIIILSILRQVITCWSSSSSLSSFASPS